MAHGMAHAPLSFVVDAPLFIVPRVLDGLRAYRAGMRDSPAPGSRAADALNLLVDALLAGLARHPTKFWVMQQFERALAGVAAEDVTTRTQFAGALESLMDILGIASSDGMLGPDHR